MHFLLHRRSLFISTQILGTSARLSLCPAENPGVTDRSMEGSDSFLVGPVTVVISDKGRAGMIAPTSCQRYDGDGDVKFRDPDLTLCQDLTLIGMT